ncbi:RbsD/FucU family protein [Chachezhania sediminis]|uniref:RbsD/FucU family protein n=1 Tax=Chachezhania sediminis TaxID=2599291 RepID=UPI00131B0982|nr:RbsD/FucU domain-containing protein [Chachezhania sediminis]
MLNGIDRRISPALLHCLARMGHGDEIVIADANFPASSIARHCQVTEALPLTGLDAVEAIDVITTLMPLDGFTDYAALRMEIDGAADTVGEVHQAAWDVLEPRLPEGGGLSSLERLAFYEHARQAFAVVLTAEARPYGCFILRKGVVF